MPSVSRSTSPGSASKPKNRATRRAAARNKIRQIENSESNIIAKAYSDGTEAHRRKETETKIPGRVTQGSTGLFTSSITSAIPKLLKTIGRPVRILNLGDGLATDAMSLRLTDTDHFLKTRKSWLPVTTEELVNHLKQTTIQRLDILPFTEAQENQAVLGPIGKREHRSPRTMSNARAYLTASHLG